VKTHDKGIDDPEIVRARRQFLQNLPLIHAEAVRLSLPITGRALHNAVRASGWEVAGDISKAAEYVKEIP